MCSGLFYFSVMGQQSLSVYITLTLHPFTEVELIDNIDYETGKMFLRQPVLQRWWQQVRGISIDRLEFSWHGDFILFLVRSDYYIYTAVKSDSFVARRK